MQQSRFVQDSDIRIEHDSMGEVQVPAKALWGAQTQRSYENFPIGSETMPPEIIQAFAILKKAAARANCQLGCITSEQASAIEQACDDILAGVYNDQFPLKVWQTGSGTQTNMNVNEVIAHIGNRALGKELLHPNDTVNRSQSSNDTFPTALHIAAACMVSDQLIPALAHFVTTLHTIEKKNEGIIKSGRTHLQDAVPIAFSQEIAGWRGLVENAIAELEAAMPNVMRLALGGTAVGTGLNAPKGFAEAAAREVAELTGKAFCSDPNKFAALTGKDALVFAHGAVKAAAANMMKIANDIRWLASGPRLGLGEITIPANEPGSSIMPGKVNPTQCEAVTMVSVQVMGNDVAIGFAASQGNFELNVFMPVIAYNFCQSVRLLTDVVKSFEDRCVKGIEANRSRMKDNLNNSLMLVTCLNPYIGYEHTAEVAKRAYAHNESLREACVALGYLSAEQFDEIFTPEEMV
ncbi:MAG TPA: class II fumarate hydratase [Candidatus Coprovicinus avistercoris]|uniref:Fumarate hydratase class II n=1 Tax=Candidatus Coprovicinus avistercoris TaxID=2840754 RepID=A0A9D1HYP4_9ACTN|nr:class II fumarate hydratase [Candidatus Coprovicinus avistercoris]